MAPMRVALVRIKTDRPYAYQRKARAVRKTMASRITRMHVGSNGRQQQQHWGEAQTRLALFTSHKQKEVAIRKADVLY